MYLIYTRLFVKTFGIQKKRRVINPFLHNTHTCSARWGAQKSVFTGDFIIGVSFKMLAQLQDPEVKVFY